MSRTSSKHNSRRATRGAAWGLAATMMLAACSGDGEGTSSGSDTGGGNGGETSVVHGLTRFFVTDLTPGATGGSNIANAVWTSLTRIEPGTGELLPGVAEDWTSQDQRTWTLTLAQGWTFHDGSTVTAQSFVDSWNVTATAENALVGNAQMSIIEGYADMNPAEGEPTATELSGAQAVDETTLEVTLTEPNVFFPYLVSSIVFAPMPEGSDANIKEFATNPIGNGPYKVRDGGWDPSDQDIFLEAYDDYPGEKAKVDEIDLRVYEDPTSIYTDFRAGTIDLALLDGANLANAQEEFPDQVVDVPFPALISLGFPVYDEAYQDPDLRLAISMAIDREAIVAALLDDNGTAATGLGPDLLEGGGAAECASCSFDPAAAKEALDAAGGWEGPMTLYTYQDPTNERILEAIANQIRDNLGIDEVNFEALEIGQLYERIGGQSLDGPALVYAGASYPHVYALADQTLVAGRLLNVTGYDNPDVNASMEAAGGASSIDEATDQTQSAISKALSANETPLTPLIWPTGGIIHTEEIQGVVPDFLGSPNLAKLEVTP